MYSYALQQHELFKLLNCNNLNARTEWKQIFQKIIINKYVYKHTLLVFMFGAHILEYV